MNIINTGAHVYASGKNRLIKISATFGARQRAGFRNMATSGTMHVRKRKRIFWDEKAWKGASYYVATLYKVMEWQNMAEALHDGETLILTLLVIAHTCSHCLYINTVNNCK